ncbi:hypothetical protein B0H65DRAFT_536842 [Neurospora tetraspora]|uniref:Uncharacterized protein n=1 Tax=Neurospora tetraspora TaxID=94610 RepID=A0AAE0JJD3_9PEZI|nr:hypothetical protein B0H65DRAFT_536842 [Neurospora tetraspora]
MSPLACVLGLLKISMMPLRWFGDFRFLSLPSAHGVSKGTLMERADGLISGLPPHRTTSCHFNKIVSYCKVVIVHYGLVTQSKAFKPTKTACATSRIWLSVMRISRAPYHGRSRSWVLGAFPEFASIHGRSRLLIGTPDPTSMIRERFLMGNFRFSGTGSQKAALSSHRPCYLANREIDKGMGKKHGHLELGEHHSNGKTRNKPVPQPRFSETAPELGTVQKSLRLVALSFLAPALPPCS